MYAIILSLINKDVSNENFIEFTSYGIYYLWDMVCAHNFEQLRGIMKRTKAMNILAELIGQHKSMKEFSSIIGEDPSNVLRWKKGRSAITLRAVINICRRNKNLQPHDLNPEIIPSDLTFTFIEKK